MRSRLTATFWIVVMIVFVGIGAYSNRNLSLTQDEATCESDDVFTSADYTVSQPIEIGGDQDFENQAATNGWLGNGTAQNPYIIQNLSISSESDLELLVNITDTTVHFEFRDSVLSGGQWGVYFWDVSHGSVTNSTIEGSSGANIYCGYCDHIWIENNTIKSSDADAHGLEWNTVYHSVIENNSIIDNGNRGMVLDYCVNLTVYKNMVAGNRYHGINLRDSNTVVIEDNTVLNSAIDGIEFGNCHHCNVTNNYVGNSIFRGIDGMITNYLRIEDNLIVNNSVCGASVSGDHSVVVNNTFYSNDQGAVAIEATDVTVSWNNFIENTNELAPCHIMDRESGNNIDYNYYDDWTWPDTDPTDGIVDEAYAIVGEALNADLHPRVMAFPDEEPHIVTKPMIVNPAVSYVPHHTAINITWGPSSDTFGHELTYAVNYSSNGGLEWTELISDLESTYYFWNITQLPEGSNYTLRVTALCSAGMSATRELSFQFEILRHVVSIPTVTHPNGGEEITNQCFINWVESHCSYDHQINYTVYYSPDGGSAWHAIATNLTSPPYDWDTSSLPRGSDYLVRVTVKCNESASAEDISDAEFSLVDMTTTTTSTLTTTTSTAAPPDEFPTLLISVIGIGAIAVIIVLISVLRKRR
jgi:parallel beta-helix repeat protein